LKTINSPGDTKKRTNSRKQVGKLLGLLVRKLTLIQAKVRYKVKVKRGREFAGTGVIGSKGQELKKKKKNWT